MNTATLQIAGQAGLSPASAAAGVACEDSGLRNEQTFCHTYTGGREERIRTHE
jgi:hypothetical protein